MALRDEWVAKTIQTVGGVARGRAASRNGMSREGTPGRSLLVVFSFHHTISQPLFFAFTPLLTFSHDILTPAAILICPARSILCFNRRAMASGPSVWSGKDPLFAVAITLSGRARVVDNESHHSLTHRLFAFSSTTFIISIRLSLHHTALHCIASHRIASHRHRHLLYPHRHIHSSRPSPALSLPQPLATHATLEHSAIVSTHGLATHPIDRLRRA
jgi:hypothetical protein